MFEETALRRFGGYIQQLMEKKDLTRQESRELFTEILTNRQPDLQQGAFLAALSAKGETAEEIAGAWEAIVEIDTNTVSMEFEEPLVENSGTGMDSLKTFNVSSAAAIVAASGGVRMARHGARALTSSCGTVDLLEAVGINVECDVELSAKSVAEIGIGLFNGMSPKVHPCGLFRILSVIRFGTTFNIAASLASPCRPTHALRGVFAESVIPRISGLMQSIGYKRGMIAHGRADGTEKGMDELSTLGVSHVREFFPDGREENYDIAPEDVGIERGRYEDVAALKDVRAESVRFLKTLSDTGHEACREITCLNAGAILYIAGMAPDLKKGVDQSRELIGSGKALETLARWVGCQCDPEGEGMRVFQERAVDAGIGSRVRNLV